MANIELIKQLRDETGISIGECKKAVEEGGSIEKAKEILKKWGKDLASKKSDRTTGQGKVDAYLHANGKIGVMVELRCETDFVANSDDFKCLAHELCLQIAAMGDDLEIILASPWIKNPSKSVKDLIEETVAKVGENIVLKKAARFEI
ncbi:MAG: elongation factor Ts [Candidatus Nealsonbacteria bacterium DGGOD1a]|jgi:Translation elongation factor Ts|nr:MAG: elongation factor Ts [Candidatus Nealsonbacteria bacterium DGGOD1a]